MPSKRLSTSSTYARKTVRRSLPSETESSIDSDLGDEVKSSNKKSNQKSNKVVSKLVEDSTSNVTEPDVEDGDDKEDENDDEEEGGEVFEVSEILDHRIKKGRHEYFVSWKGYKSSDNSWEPEEHLEGARELLIKYKLDKGLGKKPKSSRNSTASSKSAGKKTRDRDEDSDSDSDSDPDLKRTSSSKRKRVEAPSKKTSTTSIATLNRNGHPGSSKGKDKAPTKKIGKQAVPQDSDGDSTDAEEWHARYNDEVSWEHLIKSVRTIEQDDGDLLVCVLWHKEGKSTWMSNTLARAKLPQKMLDFYENHLQFNAPSSP